MANELLLPPSRHSTAPLRRSILYTVQVLRADTSRLPSVSTSTELTWK